MDDEIARWERKLDFKIIDLTPTLDGEHRKTYDEVFEKRTLMVIYRLSKKGLLKTVEHPVSSGKEANVFRAKTAKGANLALKIYRQSTATFQKLAPYVLGDPRFAKVGRSKQALRLAWARKEFANLKRMHAAGASVPEPLACQANVVAMEFVGWHDRPYPTLQELPPKDPPAFWEKLLEQWRKILSVRLVHADLSQYNILDRRGSPVIIDVAQAVLTGHPNAAEFHRRDCTNLARYFSKLLNSDLSAEKVFELVGKPAQANRGDNP